MQRFHIASIDSLLQGKRTEERAAEYDCARNTINTLIPSVDL